MKCILQPFINILLTAGYLAGLVFVWVGLETLTIEHGELSLGIFIIISGILLWTLMNIFGHLLNSIYLKRDT